MGLEVLAKPGDKGGPGPAPWPLSTATTKSWSTRPVRQYCSVMKSARLARVRCPGLRHGGPVISLAGLHPAFFIAFSGRIIYPLFVLLTPARGKTKARYRGGMQMRKLTYLVLALMLLGAVPARAADTYWPQQHTVAPVISSSAL